MDNKKEKPTLSSLNRKRTESEESCESCRPQHSVTLPDGTEVKMVTNCMTNRELQILAEMRQAREKADEIKKYLKQIDRSIEKLSTCQLPLENEMPEAYFDTLAGSRETKRLNEERQQLYYWLGKLREEWKRLDKRRVLAAEERMRLLGHID